MNEKWKPISGYEQSYQVSNLGRVRSVGRYISYMCKGKIYVKWISTKILESTRGLGKIPRVVLSNRGTRTCYSVQELVANAWVPNPNSYETIVHKDKNPFNNSADNLEWAPYIHLKSNCNNEEWRPVFNYEGLYEVSNTGKVRSVPRTVARNRIRKSKEIEDAPAYKSKELKPYSISRSGNIKYHLHRRTRRGYYGQSDEYIYAEELVRLAFPEIYSNL